MLIAKPSSLFSWNFSIKEDGREIALIDQAWLRERSEVTIEGDVHTFARTDMLNGVFELLRAGQTVARAQKTSLFQRAFEVSLNGRSLILRAAHPFTRRFELIEGDSLIGQIAPRHMFTRTAEIDLEKSIPLAVRIFSFWLVMIMWRR